MHRFRTDHFGEPLKVERVVDELSGEKAIDAALLEEDFAGAVDIADALVDEAREHLEAGLYPENFGRIVLKRITLPLAARDSLDRAGAPTPEWLGVGAIHAEGLALLEDMSAVYDMTTLERPFVSEEADMVRGDLSEFTVFSMTTRLISGQDTDALSIRPSSFVENQNTAGIQDWNNGFDFWVRQRRTGSTAKIQIKSSIKQSRVYAKDVLVIATDELTGTSSPHIRQETRITRRRQLREALIQDGVGELSVTDDILLKAATQRLLSRYYSRLGEPAVRPSMR